jgi:exosome complex RNA-binding protein Rrp42 (RNase PH superfamily)
MLVETSSPLIMVSVQNFPNMDGEDDVRRASVAADRDDGEQQARRTDDEKVKAAKADEGDDSDRAPLESWLRLTRAASVLLDRKLRMEMYWEKDAREDGRMMLQCRPTTIRTGVVASALSLQNHRKWQQERLQRQGRGIATTCSEPATATTVAGSSLVGLGGTQVLAVITLHVGYVVVSAASDQRSWTPSSSLSPSSSSRPSVGGDVVVTCSSRSYYSHSATTADPARLASYLQRVVEETVDLEQLCIRPRDDGWSASTTGGSTAAGAAAAAGQKPTTAARHQQAFRLCLGVEVLVDHGNVRDAALLACTAALADTWLPEAATLSASAVADGSAATGDSRLCLILPNGEDTRGNGRPLACSRLPVPLTIGIWEGSDECGARNRRHQLVVDPTRDEQAALSGMITMVVDADARGSVIADKDESCVLSVEMTVRADLETIALATKLAKGRALELLPILRP